MSQKLVKMCLKKKGSRSLPHPFVPITLLLYLLIVREGATASLAVGLWHRLCPTIAPQEGQQNRKQREGVSTTEKWVQTKSKPESKSSIKGEMRDRSGGCFRNLAEYALVWGLKKLDI